MSSLAASGSKADAVSDRAAALNGARGGVRTRTFSWEDPAPALAQGRELAGLDYVRAIAAGAIARPPIAALLGLEIVEVEPGRVTFALDPAEWMYNPIGSVHGGVAATVLDSCMGCAVHTLLAAGVAYTTTDLQVRYGGR